MSLDRCAHCQKPITNPQETVFMGDADGDLQYVHRECFTQTKVYAEDVGARARRLETPPRTRTDTIIFLIALGVGAWIGWRFESLPGAVGAVLVATAILGTIAIVVAGWLLSRLLPSSMRSPYGITVPRDRISYIFGGLIATLGVIAVLAALVRQFTR